MQLKSWCLNDHPCSAVQVAIDASLTNFVEDLLQRKPGLLAAATASTDMREIRALFESYLPSAGTGSPQLDSRLDKAAAVQLLQELQGFDLVQYDHDSEFSLPDAGLSWEEFCRDYIPAKSAESPSGGRLSGAQKSLAPRLGQIEGRLGRLESQMEKIGSQLDQLIARG